MLTVVYYSSFFTNPQSENRVRGEFTIVLGPYQAPMLTADEEDRAITTALMQLRSDGMARSEAVKVVVNTMQLPKSTIYKAALKIQEW